MKKLLYRPCLMCLACVMTLAPNAFAYVAIADTPTTVTYADAAGVQQIRVFAVGTNGHLLTDAWDGTAWQWSDLGLPPGYDRVYSPSAVTYLDSGGNRQIRVFALGAPGPIDLGASLVAAAWDGAWNWYDLRGPGGFLNLCRDCGMTAITYPDLFGTPTLAVFAILANGYALEEDFWDGYTWTWSDFSRPDHTNVVFNPSAVAYLDEAGHRNVRVFVESGFPSPFLDVFSVSALALGDNSFEWFRLGYPASGVETYCPHAVTYQFAGVRQIRVFTGGNDGHLYADAWDGAGWTWSDLGQPSSGAAGCPNAVAYADADGTHLRVFASGADQHLWAAGWDGADWSWFDLGAPFIFPPLSKPSRPDAITYATVDGVQQIRVFNRYDSFLVADAWDGAGWVWFDLSTP